MNTRRSHTHACQRKELKLDLAFRSVAGLLWKAALGTGHRLVLSTLVGVLDVRHALRLVMRLRGGILTGRQHGGFMPVARGADTNQVCREEFHREAPLILILQVRRRDNDDAN